MDLGLRDKVFVVTGGSQGLGLATAEALVAEGARVMLSARDERALERAAASLGGLWPPHGGSSAGWTAL